MKKAGDKALSFEGLVAGGYDLGIRAEQFGFGTREVG